MAALDVDTEDPTMSLSSSHVTDNSTSSDDASTSNDSSTGDKDENDEIGEMTENNLYDVIVFLDSFVQRIVDMQRLMLLFLHARTVGCRAEVNRLYADGVYLVDFTMKILKALKRSATKFGREERKKQPGEPVQ